MFVSSHIEYAIKSHPQQMIDSHIPHMHDANVCICACLCVCVRVRACDERVVPTPGIYSVMKHSKGVARGVYSTPGCKMKLWKSNLLHSRRPIAFITTEALKQRLYFTKINITVSRYSPTVGWSDGHLHTLHTRAPKWRIKYCWDCFCKACRMYSVSIPHTIN